MILAKTIGEVRRAVAAGRREGGSIGFVPTMGALHEGHASLIRASRERDEVTVVSIFVNPIQFAAGEDLNAYPRTLDRDVELCRELGVGLVFAPEAGELNPGAAVVRVEVRELAAHLCGPFRPGHFAGVATIVARLFNIVGPDRAYFGAKDAQQAAIVQRLVRDLDFPIEIVVCPTVREADGLAMSSRNAYLSAAERRQAGSLYRALRYGEGRILAGARSAGEVVAEMRRIVEEAGPCRIDYIEIVERETLRPVESLRGGLLVALAVHIGRARLIDNVSVDAPEGAS